jgi:hypothetical protein
MRFFGNKQRLLVTALDLPVDVEHLVRTVAEGDAQGAGERLAGFVVRLLQDPARASIVTGLIRCAVSEPEAARLLRERFVRDVLTPLVVHVGMDQAELRGALVASQIHGLVLARQVLQLDPLTSIDPEELARLIAPTLQRYLAGPL